MAYDPSVVARIDALVADWSDTVPRKMFGGVCYLHRGNMACGVWQDQVILRLGERAAAEAMQERFVRPFDVTGRPMKGWVMVEPPGFATEEALAGWLDQARAFVETLPAKG